VEDKPLEARCYINGQLVLTVRGYRNETANQLKARINVVIAVDADKQIANPVCPQCKTNYNVWCGVDAWHCSHCGTSFIPKE
jgi:transposase-like protein